MSSAAQFIVFREKRKMVRRGIFREKLLTKKIRKELANFGQNWCQFDVKIALLEGEVNKFLLVLFNFN